jgi:hypothetical protein
MRSLGEKARDTQSTNLVARLQAAYEASSTPDALAVPILAAREQFVELRNGGASFAEAQTSALTALRIECLNFLTAEFPKRGKAAPLAISLFSDLCSSGMLPHEAVGIARNGEFVSAWTAVSKSLPDAQAKAGLKSRVIQLLSSGEPVTDAVLFLKAEVLGATLPEESKSRREYLEGLRGTARAKLADLNEKKIPETAKEHKEATSHLARLAHAETFYVELVCALRATLPTLSGAKLDEQAWALARHPEAATAMASVLAREETEIRPGNRQRLRASFIEKVIKRGRPSRPESLNEAAFEACQEFGEGNADGTANRIRSGGGGRSNGKGVGSGE